jgi:hypothetical protein
VFDLSIDVGPPLQIVSFERVGGKNWRTRELPPQDIARIMGRAESVEPALPEVFAKALIGEPTACEPR